MRNTAGLTGACVTRNRMNTAAVLASVLYSAPNIARDSTPNYAKLVLLHDIQFRGALPVQRHQPAQAHYDRPADTCMLYMLNKRRVLKHKLPAQLVSDI